MTCGNALRCGNVNGRLVARELRERQEGTRQRDESFHLLKIVDEGRHAKVEPTAVRQALPFGGQDGLGTG